MWAAMNNKTDDVMMLVQEGADVRWRNKFDGLTVFDHARVRDNEEMLEVLKQHQQVSGIF